MEEVKGEIEKEYDRPVDILAGSKDNEIPDSGKEKEGISEKLSAAVVEDEISKMLLRRPCTASEIAATLSMTQPRTSEVLKDMENRGCLTVKIHGGKKYYRTVI